MKKLAVDISFLHDQYYRRGIGRYGREIVSRMVTEQNREVGLHLIGFEDFDSNIAKLELTQQPNIGSLHFHSLGNAQNSSPVANGILYHQKLKPLIDAIKPDLYFAVHFDRIVPSSLCPTAVTIHDLIPFVTGKFSQKNAVINAAKSLYYRYALGKALQSKLLFTVSEYSRNDIVEFGVAPEKIVVTPEGVSDIFTRENLDRDILKDLDLEPESYLLYDSGHEPNKNTFKLLDLIKGLDALGLQVKLVVTGRDFAKHRKELIAKTKLGSAFADYANKLGIADSVLASGTVSEEELAVLFRNSLAYVNLSSYEGFGLGILQAFASATPAIIANRTTYPEVAGDAALLVDPDELEKSLQEIFELLSNLEQREALVAKGNQRLKSFSWDSCYTQTWQALNAVI